jgi:hypothetical protein
MNIKMLFWVLAPCGFVGRWQRFGETSCLHLQGLSNRELKGYVGSEERSMFLQIFGIDLRNYTTP